MPHLAARPLSQQLRPNCQRNPLRRVQIQRPCMELSQRHTPPRRVQTQHTEPILRLCLEPRPQRRRTPPLRRVKPRTKPNLRLCPQRLRSNCQRHTPPLRRVQPRTNLRLCLDPQRLRSNCQRHTSPLRRVQPRTEPNRRLCLVLVFRQLRNIP